MRKNVLLLLAILCLSASASAEARTVLPSAASRTEAAPPAHEEKKPAPANLSEREKKDVARVESYLNALKSVSARFLQVSDSGAMRHGAIAIQRPGKMRVTYDPPDKDFIVADGSFLNIWDDELQQATTVSLGEGIADFILREKISLSDDVVITRFAYYPAKIEVSLVSLKEPEQGELTLIFEDRPLKLRQWRVVDTQGRMTGVNLENAREDVSFENGTFSFIPPNIGKTGRGARQ